MFSNKSYLYAQYDKIENKMLFIIFISFCWHWRHNLVSIVASFLKLRCRLLYIDSEVHFTLDICDVDTDKDITYSLNVTKAICKCFFYMVTSTSPRASQSPMTSWFWCHLIPSQF